MGCNCIKLRDTPLSRARKLADTLAKKENRNYVIYEMDNELLADTEQGWRNDGQPGTLREVIYAL